MVQGELGEGRGRWPIHSAHFWSGLLVGLGVGLLLGAALVELELLTSQRKAWVSLLGAVLAGVGGLIGRRGQPSTRIEAESGTVSDRGSR